MKTEHFNSRSTPNEAKARSGRSFWLYVPPPPLYVVTFLAGRFLGGRWPLALVPERFAFHARVVGIAVALCGPIFMFGAALLFLLRRTTIIPHGEARRLVTGGPFRVTRNPMYVGMTLVFIGIAIALNAAWPLLLLPLPLWVMHTRVIPHEERTLERLFGDEYRGYKARVRRWL